MERKQENQLSIIPSQNKSLKKTSTLPTLTSHDKNDSFSETLFAVPVSLLVFIFLVIPVILVMRCVCLVS